MIVFLWTWIFFSEMAFGQTSDYLVCRKDYLTKCSSSWEIVEKEDYFCLQAEYEKLSVECQALIIRKTRDKCINDALKFCEGIKVRVDYRFKCLEKFLDKVSPACKAQFDLHYKRDAEQTLICEKDYEKSCPGTEKLGLNDCMYNAYGKGELSGPCVKYISIRYPHMLYDFPKIKP